MSHIIIATPELSDAAVLTASHETAPGPVSQLKTQQPTEPWVADSLTPYVIIDLGAVKTFNAIAVLASNATASCTWRIRTADTEADLTAAPDFDPGPAAFVWLYTEDKFKNAFYWIPAGQTNRFIRIDFSDPTNADGIFFAGRLFVANATQFVRNFSYGAASTWNDESPIDEMEGGQLIPMQKTNRETFSFSLDLVGETERHTLREILRTRGGTKDVLVVEDPAATVNLQDKIHPGLMQLRREVVNSAFNVHTAVLEVRHLITDNDVLRVVEGAAFVFGDQFSDGFSSGF